MMYDNSSINKFVQKQGGSLENLGASPTYTGAPAMRGTPPGPQGQQAPQAMQQANPNAAFQRPQMPAGYGQRPPAGMPQTSLANLGNRMDPRMQQMRQQLMMQRRNARQADPRQDPRMRQRMEMIRRQRMANPRRGNLQNLGQPGSQPPVMTTNPVGPNATQHI